MSTFVPYIAGILCVIGAFFVLVAAIGLLRLDDLYMRMHAASKAGTVGVGGLFAALAVFFGETDVVLRAMAGFVFFLLTAPVSAHLLAKAAYTAGYKPCAQTKHDALSEREGTEYHPT
ncbi:monovalent cation/H(+) antiporter subunit G [Acuticoccus sp. I52.16.1]|uniref:monovalent cation/H(+) antiporter subunit G n=1 Tax=Acuticoccus sp. I52.16.1 TaxID=2928472 RepID=UPI001FD19D8A|nr:monovalent cation/H(+) antiporter subunit G [Acuticoccus sp. I52.16.1]UOM34346.1 monovalent cation/H(+) antiporter subunit G [Acuticoccus sp. I52.16.1]